MADLEVEEQKPQAGHREGKEKNKWNWKDKERELQIDLYDCLWNVAYELMRTVSMNRN